MSERTAAAVEGEIVAQGLDEPTSIFGEGVDQVGIVDVFDRDPGLGDDHQRQFFDRGHTVRATPKVAITMRCDPGTASHSDLPLEARRHAAMQVLAEEEGLVRQVFDDELVARAGRGELLTSPMSSMSRRGPAPRPDPADRAQVPLGQLRFALGRTLPGCRAHPKSTPLASCFSRCTRCLRITNQLRLPVMRSDQRLKPASPRGSEALP